MHSVKWALNIFIIVAISRKYQLTSRRQIWIWKGDKDKKGSMCCPRHIKDSIVNLLQLNIVVREELQTLLNVCELFIGVFKLKS